MEKKIKFHRSFEEYNLKILEKDRKVNFHFFGNWIKIYSSRVNTNITLPRVEYTIFGTRSSHQMQFVAPLKLRGKPIGGGEGGRAWERENR